MHDMPGTTRDAIDTVVQTDVGLIRFIDTAGMRRRAKTEAGLETYAVLRSLVVKMDEAVTEASPMARAPDENARRHDDFGDDGDDDDMPAGMR